MTRSVSIAAANRTTPPSAVTAGVTDPGSCSPDVAPRARSARVATRPILPENTSAKSRSSPTATAGNPAPVMMSVMPGWLATSTSWPAERSAQASGTSG